MIPREYLKLYNPWWYWDYQITCTLENTSEAHKINDDAFAQNKISAPCKCGVFSNMFQLSISTKPKLTIIQYMM